MNLRRRLHRSKAAQPPFIDALELRGPKLFEAIKACVQRKGFALEAELGLTTWKRPLWLFVRRAHAHTQTCKEGL